MTSDQLDPTVPPADPFPRRVRLLLWIAGMGLWALAVFGIYVIWKGRQMTGDGPPAISGTSAVVASPDRSAAAGGGPQPIVLEPSQNARPPARAWDPNGLPDFEFTERSGRRISKQDLLGTPWAVSFIFTRCQGPCVSITAQMRKLQQETKGSGIRLVSITVDPEFDTPEMLTKYANAFGAEPDRWLFLTGDKDQTYRLIRDSFLMPVQEMTGADRKPGWEVLHSNNILHVNARGVVVGKYVGTDDADVARLRRETLKEARSLDPQPPSGTDRGQPR